MGPAAWKSQVALQAGRTYGAEPRHHNVDDSIVTLGRTSRVLSQMVFVSGRDTAVDNGTNVSDIVADDLRDGTAASPIRSDVSLVFDALISLDHFFLMQTLFQTWGRSYVRWRLCPAEAPTCAGCRRRPFRQVVCRGIRGPSVVLLAG